MKLVQILSSCRYGEFGTCEPLRHSTCLLLLCSSCPKFKFGTKVLIYIKVHKTALNDCLPIVSLYSITFAKVRIDDIGRFLNSAIDKLFSSSGNNGCPEIKHIFNSLCFSYLTNLRYIQLQLLNNILFLQGSQPKSFEPFALH